MARYLLDTNHASPLVTLHHILRKHVMDRAASGDIFSIALPALTEVIYGISTLPRARSNLEAWATLQNALIVLTLTQKDAEFAARIQIEARAKANKLLL